MKKAVKKRNVKTISETVTTKTKNIVTGKQISVKNASGEPDTTATILVQNSIKYTPKVSVIIPVYNVQDYLRQCLDTVVNQTLKEIEIICVDDGSTDNSLKILKEYAKKDNRITLLAQKNLHAGVARNAGLAVAKGEYLQFLDSDDFFELNMLEETTKKADKDKSDIIMFNCYLHDEQNGQDNAVAWTLRTELVQQFKTFNYKDVPDYIFTLSNCWVWNRLYRSNFIRKKHLQFQNLACGNDTYFSCMAQVFANKISFIDTRFVHYRTKRLKQQNVTASSYRKKHPTDLLYCFHCIYNELIAHKVYSSVKNSYIKVSAEHITWSRGGMLNTPNSLKKFDTYFAEHFESIFSSDDTNGLDKSVILKYNILRNILIDNGLIHEIPKRIFYVWGAGEQLKDKAKECIDTWRKFLPEYDIIQLDESNTEYFDYQKELKSNKWFKTVYDKKMWAYVADYIRIKTLYDHGGIYFDTDVSVIQNMNKFLKEPAFVGMQMSSLDGTGDWVEPAILGSQKGNNLLGDIAHFYDDLIWKLPIYTMPQIFNHYLRQHDIYPFPARKEQKIIKLDNITIYPEKYFIPFRFRDTYSPNCIKPETHTVHWWGGSWTKPEILDFLKNKHIKNTGVKVSVVVPVYNVEKYLPECLDSVINQTLKEIEIICVNDGSPDNSLSVLQEYAKKDNRIRIINQKNQGLSCSRNNALKIAKGEYILFLDSDDYIRQDACEKLYTKSKMYNIDMTNFAGTNFDSETRKQTQFKFQTIFYTPNNKDHFNKYELDTFADKIPISACRFFYRRGFLEYNDLLFPSGINFEDNYFVRKALLFVNEFGIEKETLYFRRLHGGSITQNVDKFFGDYIEVINRVVDLYESNNVPRTKTFDIINNYMNMLSTYYNKFYLANKSIYYKRLIELQTRVNTLYNMNHHVCPPDYIGIITEWYYRIIGKKLNINNPKTFNEKIQWLKIYDSTPIKTKLADKFLVRDWVKSKIGEKYLIPLLGVYDKFDDIDFDKLPNQFVMKSNHGSGWNIVVKDKSKLDIADAKAKFDKWLDTNFAFMIGCELHYRDIKPKIIIEKYITNDGKNLYDYKFWCFNGEVKYMQFRDDFSKDLKMAFYDLQWKKQHFYYDHPLLEGELEKPDNFDEMVDIAKKLCKGFCFVCVDLYRLNNGNIKFGEMTFTRSSGTGKWNDDKYNKMLGDMIKLPKHAYNIDTGEYYKLKKIRSKRIVKPYLLFPYYMLASVFMRCIRIPMINFGKFIIRLVKRIFSVNRISEFSHRIYLLGFKITVTNHRKRDTANILKNSQNALYQVKIILDALKKQMIDNMNAINTQNNKNYSDLNHLLQSEFHDIKSSLKDRFNDIATLQSNNQNILLQSNENMVTDINKSLENTRADMADSISNVVAHYDDNMADINNSIAGVATQISNVTKETVANGISNVVAHYDDNMADINNSIAGVATQISNVTKETVAKLGSNFNGIIQQIDATAKKMSIKNAEPYWANVYRDTSISSAWLKDKSVSPGRWAVSYIVLYVLYRILDEIQPKSILECGLGQSSKLTIQYADSHNADLTICENSSEWLDFFMKQFPSAKEYTKILDTKMVEIVPPFQSRTYANFDKAIKNKKFNFVLIDGPRGSEHYSRPEILDIVDNLDKSFVIMLDDMNRIGEQETWAKLKQKLNEKGIEFREALYHSDKSVGLLCSPDLEYLTTL